MMLSFALGASQPMAADQTTKYGVTVRTVNRAELAKAKTYIWEPGQPAFSKRAHDAIVTAVDRELIARGLMKRPSSPSDLTVTYSSVSRTDVNSTNAPTTGEVPSFDVGILVVDLNSAASRELLFRARVDTPFEREQAALEAAIDAAVKALFQKYPAGQTR